MIDLKKIKPEIVERLLPLNPDKIILFGSYANGEANEDSDIDLFIMKDNITLEDTRVIERQARRYLRDLIFKYKIGIDILSGPTGYVQTRDNYFYKEDIRKNGIVWYE